MKKLSTSFSSLLLAGLSAACLGSAASATAAERDVLDVMTRNYAVTRVDTAVFDATFTLINKQGSERVRKTVGSSKLKGNGLDQMRMTRFVAPADVSGMATLVHEHAGTDDDIWIFLPAMKKVRRLVSDNKKDSFLGTDFSYADVIGYPVNEWNYSLVREERVNGDDCYVVSGVPKSEAVKSNSGYAKRMEWVSKNSFATVKSEFWDEQGQKLKTATFSDIRNVDQKTGKWQAMRMEATNAQSGHRTVIQFGNFKVNQPVDDQVFTTRQLEKQ